jgi:trehalose 6-phosphate phosphatase
MSVLIDPRRVDAVLFDLDDGLDATFAARLRDAGVRLVSADGAALAETAGALGVRPGRCAVVTTTEQGVTDARAGGFALVIVVDPAGTLRSRDADAVVANVNDVDVRGGDRRMSELPDGLQVLSLTSTRQPAVFFDFDGTLSEIVNDADSARLADGAAEALTSLCAHCPVAILSGRDLADVRQRIGLPGLWYAGSHGFELTGPDGKHHENADAAASIPVLAGAAAELADQLGDIPGVVVEHKRFGVAVHYRNAGRDRVGEVSAAVRSAGQRTGLRVTTGREVIELRPDVDWDKGKTLRWVLDYIRDNEGSNSLQPIYLGDDITDEDAFRALAGRGIGIFVGRAGDPEVAGRSTHAAFVLDSTEEVERFLDRLAR